MGLHPSLIIPLEHLPKAATLLSNLWITRLNVLFGLSPGEETVCVCTGMSCFGKVWWGFVVLLKFFFVLFCLIFLESLDVNFRSFLSVPLLGLRFNEASRDERRVVCGGCGGGDASKCTKDVAAAPSQSWEKPLLLFFPQKCCHRWWFINQIR